MAAGKPVGNQSGRKIMSDTKDWTFAHNLAKLSLVRALGNAEQRLPDYIKAQ